MIYKAFIGKHIDLSKIVAIGDACFLDRMGRGGWYVGFSIDCQLLDHPLTYERRLTSEEYKFFKPDDEVAYRHLMTIDYRHHMVLTDGTMAHSQKLYGVSQDQMLCVANLQKQIDGLVDAWKLWDK